MSEPPRSKRTKLDIERHSSKILGISRSIAACKRCRLKKVKCDQGFPKCSRCTKADAECVSLDPATGRDVPRSYVIHLEDRISALEKRLKEVGVDPKTVTGSSMVSEDNQQQRAQIPETNQAAAFLIDNGTSIGRGLEPGNHLHILHAHIDKIGSTQQKAPYLGDSSGITFAKLMFTALNYTGSIDKLSSIELTSRVEPAAIEVDPFFLPPKDKAEHFLSLYFSSMNPQTPILHREYFLRAYFEPIYGPVSKGISFGSDYTSVNYDFQLPDNKNVPSIPWISLLKTETTEVPKEYHVALYFLNMVFAVASSVELLSNPVTVAKSYKERAIVYMDAVYSSEDKLESLAGVLLLTLYSIMKPNVPGVWYVLGSALRLSVDLGLHAEKLNRNYDPFTRDLRRRLFWSVYCMDRQVCASFGRPFGIPEECISARFPSELDDALITPQAEVTDFSHMTSGMSSYKVLSLSMIKLRRIQSKIATVLYAQNSELPRSYSDIEQWRSDIEQELETWRQNVPKTHRKMNCSFNLTFFDFNYHQCRLMLFGLTPKVLVLDDNMYEKVYEAAKNIIEVYFDLYQTKAINYTWVAVHNLFMAGMTYLYSIYDWEGVDTTEEELQTNSRKVLDVLQSLRASCDAATNCYKIYQILSGAVLKIKFQGGERPVSSMSNIKMILNDTYGIAGHTADLDQFFSELKKPSPSGSSESERLQPMPSAYTAAFSDITQPFEALDTSEVVQPHIIGASMVNSKATAAPSTLNTNVPTTKDGQRVFDMIYKVSTESIWDQFFNNFGHGAGGNNGAL